MTGALVGTVWSDFLKARAALDPTPAIDSKTPSPKPEPPAAPMTCPRADRSMSKTSPSHPLLPGFRGDTQWIHRREGHVGRPYWPGGDSGITLDPGMDLGHAEPWLIEAAFEKRLPAHQLKAVRKAMGAQGTEAQTLLRRSGTLRGIQISRSTAAGVFPYLLKPYWRSLQQRFPSIIDPEVPPEVQTAMLSLAYNRGTWNLELSPIHHPLKARRWEVVARLIRDMQQDHLLEGIRRRRRFESLLISENLAVEPMVEICRSIDSPETSRFRTVEKEIQEPES